MNCMSTHGGAGWPEGSYQRGDKVVCGACGVEVENPRFLPYGVNVERKCRPSLFLHFLLLGMGLGFVLYGVLP